MILQWHIGLSLIISLCCFWVGYKSFLRSKRHAPSDLYDRQKGIFDSVMKFIAETCQCGDTNNESLLKLLRETKDSELYFKGTDIKKYVDELYKKGLDLEYANKFLNDHNLPVGERRTELAEKSYDLMTYFSGQFKVAKNLFGSYLKVKN